MPDYISTKDAAARLGVIQRRVLQYIAQGRVPGAVKLGRDWIIPSEFTVRETRRPASWSKRTPKRRGK